MVVLAFALGFGAVWVVKRAWAWLRPKHRLRVAPVGEPAVETPAAAPPEVTVAAGSWTALDDQQLARFLDSHRPD